MTVPGTAGVAPAALSVLLNVTVTDTTAPSYLDLWPDGKAKPVASSLNWLPGWTIPNAVTAGAGMDGRTAIYNSIGATDVIADASGWYG